MAVSRIAHRVLADLGLRVVRRVDRCEPVRLGGDVAFREEIQLRVGVGVAGTGGAGAADAEGGDLAAGE